MIKNPKLALAISDASWGELVRQLDYKCDWYGRTLTGLTQLAQGEEDFFHHLALDK
jgi:hypothetical protein